MMGNVVKMRKIAVYKTFGWGSWWIFFKKICYLLRKHLSKIFATLFAITSLFVFLIGMHLEYALSPILWFGSVIQPWTTVSEPCLTPVSNTNWRLILQLISRASKLLVTEDLQHEPDLMKRSFYWILSEGAPLRKHGSLHAMLIDGDLGLGTWPCWDQVWGTLSSSLWISQDTMGMRGNISQFICTRRMLHNI